MTWLIPLFLLVVTEPYKNLNYEKINVYIIHEDENSVKVYESEEETQDFNLSTPVENSTGETQECDSIIFGTPCYSSDK